MTLNEFIDTYIGKKVDFDGVYGAQCVDLFRQYCKDVWNVPHTGGVNGARELFFQQSKGLLYSQKCEVGDSVIYDKSPTNQYGHVAIVLYTTDKTLVVFEQDGFKLDGAKVTARTKDNVLGYIRKEIT